MVKFNLEFHESVQEAMLAFLVGIINEIEEAPEKNPDQIITNFLDNYYQKKSPIEHSFSDDVIEFVKNDIILGIIEVNKEDFKDVSQSVMNRLIAFFEDFFIDRFNSYRKSIELKE